MKTRTPEVSSQTATAQHVAQARPTRTTSQPRRRADHLSRLSFDERVACTRLVRVLRDRSYWVGPFIEWLLTFDPSLPKDEMLSMKTVAAELAELIALQSWEKVLREWRPTPLIKIPGLMYFQDRVEHESAMAVDKVNGDTDFLELVRLWRLNHPAPEPRRRVLNVPSSEDEE